MEGQDTVLQCFYDLEGIPLYSVKWYRGRHEFYRFSPSEHPSSKIFPIPGIDVDVSTLFIIFIIFQHFWS
ncbi:hypothetical protein WDU94_003982 [Cyamophila willieti]